jgi:hypothetical protein
MDLKQWNNRKQGGPPSNLAAISNKHKLLFRPRIIHFYKNILILSRDPAPLRQKLHSMMPKARGLVWTGVLPTFARKEWSGRRDL